MTWDGVVHIMEEIGFPVENWETAEFLWLNGERETLLHVLNAHALDQEEGLCRPLQSFEFRMSFPVPAEPWAHQAAERLIQRTKNCPRKLLNWIVARVIEEEFDRRDDARARESQRKMQRPPSSESEG